MGQALSALFAWSSWSENPPALLCLTQSPSGSFVSLSDPNTCVNRMVTRHVKQCIRKEKKKSSSDDVRLSDVKHLVLVHLPIHVINFLNICDKNNSWAASPGASVDRLMQTSAALGFLLGFLLVWGRTRSFWAKFRGRRASGKIWEGKSRDHWACHLPESFL